VQPDSVKFYCDRNARASYHVLSSVRDDLVGSVGVQVGDT